MCHKKLKVGSKSNPATPVHQTIAALSEKITQGVAAPSTPMIQAPPANVPVPRMPVAAAGLKRDHATMMDGNDAVNRRIRLTSKQPCTFYYSTMPRMPVAAAGLKRGYARMMEGKDAADRRTRLNSKQPCTPYYSKNAGTPGAAAAQTPVGAVECTPKIKHANTGGTRRTADLPAPLTPGVTAPTTPGIYGSAPGTPARLDVSNLRLRQPEQFRIPNLQCFPVGIHLKDPWCEMVLSGEKIWDIRGCKKPPVCPAQYNIIRKHTGIVGHVEVAAFFELDQEDFDKHFDKHKVHRDHTYIYTYIHTDTIVRRLLMVCTTGEFDRVKWCGRRLGTGIGREEERL